MSTVFHLFPTQKQKRFFYPIRPLFTFLMTLFFVGLGVVGILPISLAIWLAMVLGIDDFTLVPFLRTAQSVTNLMNGRKKTKSIIALIAISIGIIGGIVLGLTVLSSLPIVVTAMTWLTSTLGTSLLVSSVCMVIGGLVGISWKRINPLIGIAVGSVVSLLIPIPVPIVVECVFLGIIAVSFLTGLIAKQGLRIYNKLRYGHTNADGYQLNQKPSKIELDNEKQAAILHVKTTDVAALKEICLRATKGIKKRCHVGHDLSSSRWQLSNSFKDIYHFLMQAKNEEDRQFLQELLCKSVIGIPADTTGSSKSDIPRIRPEYMPLYKTAFAPTDLELRKLFHKQGMDAAFFKLEKKQDEYTLLREEFNKAIQPFLNPVLNTSLRQPG